MQPMFQSYEFDFEGKYNFGEDIRYEVSGMRYEV
jgi:hypothetical protein